MPDSIPVSEVVGSSSLVLDLTVVSESLVVAVIHIIVVVPYIVSSSASVLRSFSLVLGSSSSSF